MCRFLKKMYDSIQEYIDRYIDITILYTYFTQPPFLLTHKCNCKARLDRPNGGSRSAGEGLCVLQSFLFTTQQEH